MQRILRSNAGLCSCSYPTTKPPGRRLVAPQQSRELLRHTPKLQAASRPDDGVSEEERVSKVLQGVTRRIKQLGAQGKVRDAIQELAGLSALGIAPDTQAATAVVQACAARDMPLAQSIFDELFSGELLQPDEVAFAVLLRGYGASTPPDWPMIDATLTAMRMKHGLSPSATSFNVLLEVCVRTNDLERGQDVIDRMAQDDVEPDVFTEEVVSRRKALRAYLRKVLL